MSIFDKLKKLKEIKENIFKALVNKGVEVDASAPFSSYADYIKNMSSSGTIQSVQYKSTNLTSPITQSTTDFTDLEGNENLKFITCHRPIKGSVDKIEACIVFEKLNGGNLASIYFFSDVSTYGSIKVSSLLEVMTSGGTLRGSGKNSSGNWIGTAISSNKKYYYRFRYDPYKKIQTYELSEDGITYRELEKNENITFTYYENILANTAIEFNLNGVGDSTVTGAQGTFKYYLDECYVKINDEIWWDKTTYETELTEKDYKDLILQDKVINSLEMFDADYIAKTHHQYFKTINAPNATYVPCKACQDNTVLTVLNAPKLKVIEAFAFDGCTSLTSVDLSNAKYIGAYAFEETKLEGKIEISNDVMIKDRAFSNIKTITEINMPNAICDGQYIFNGCSGLIKVNLLNTEKLESYMFTGCSSLNEILILNLKEIGASVFQNCASLSFVDCSLVTSLGGYAFDGCTSLSNIDLSKVTTIGNYALRKCTSLNKVDLSSVTSIGTYVFTNCTQSLKVWIPSTCTTIGTSLANSSNVTFYTDLADANSRPSGWNSKWNGSGTVVYGTTYEAFLAA